MKKRLTMALVAGVLVAAMVPGVATPAAAGGKVTCHGKVATIVGTRKRDVIYGTNHADVIAGLGGNDVIIGRGGNDIICGGPGADRLVGKAGLDRLYGNAGPDKLFGGNGPDRLFGGVGNDRLVGQLGDDHLNGGPGTDRCYQGTGSGAEVSCEPFPLPLTGILAVAYSDIDGLDGYSSGDVLIAKLVDTDGNGIPTIGDTVKMGRYPTNLEATTFGDWGVKSHEVTAVVHASGVELQVEVLAQDFTWTMLSEGSAERYVEFLAGYTEIVDGKGADRDVIRVDPNSPSQPDQAVTLDPFGSGDGGFIDVQLNYQAPG